MIICLTVKKQKDVKNYAMLALFFSTKIGFGGIVHAYSRTAEYEEVESTMSFA